jgi:hypothetical protein
LPTGITEGTVYCETVSGNDITISTQGGGTRHLGGGAGSSRQPIAVSPDQPQIAIGALDIAFH